MKDIIKKLESAELDPTASREIEGQTIGRPNHVRQEVMRRIVELARARTHKGVWRNPVAWKPIREQLEAEGHSRTMFRAVEELGARITGKNSKARLWPPRHGVEDRIREPPGEAAAASTPPPPKHALLPGRMPVPLSSVGLLPRSVATLLELGCVTVGEAMARGNLPEHIGEVQAAMLLRFAAGEDD
jgi:hypothetical protein